MSGEPRESPVINASSIHSDGFPTDLAVRIGSFWTGKEFSTYLFAARASKKLRDAEDSTNTKIVQISKGIIKSLTKRCAEYLDSIDAPDAMKQTWREQSDAALRDIEALQSNIKFMEPISEWCAFLDYMELVPFRLSQARLAQDDPSHALWIIGSGKFDVTSVQSSPVILSVPTCVWRPELLFLSEKWLDDFVRRNPLLTNSFPMATEQIENDLPSSVAIMSWKDAHYLEFMHHQVDIRAGMLVYHSFGERGNINDNSFVEGSYLNWLPKAWCDIHTDVRGALERSEHLKWLCKGTRYDQNMLASFEINDTTIPSDHMRDFGRRIVKVMKEVQEWY